MKIQPTPPLNSGAERIASPERPGRAFEDLLSPTGFDGMEAQEQGNLPQESPESGSLKTRAVSFDGYGMFGRFAATVAQAMKEQPQVGAPSEQPQHLEKAPSSELPSVAMLPPQEQSRQLGAAGHRAPSRDALVHFHGRGRFARAIAAEAAKVEVQPPALEASADEVPQARGAQFRSARAVQPPKAHEAVLLFEESGLAEVVLASPFLGAEAKERLRQRSAEILAEFGLALDRFHHNGRSVPFSNSIVKGALNGTRTR